MINLSDNIFKNSTDISNRVKQILDEFLGTPNQTEEDTIKLLAPIFDKPKNRTLMINRQKFRAAFRNKLGENRIAVLKNLLIIHDPSMYSKIE